MKKYHLALAILLSFSTLSIAQPYGAQGDHQERTAEAPYKDEVRHSKKQKHYNKKYPSSRYYYSKKHDRYYHRHYSSSHRYVRCQDGVVVRAKPNACRNHRGALYYW